MSGAAYVEGEVQTLFLLKRRCFLEKICNSQKWCSVIKALSGGYRGGNWNNDATNARVSDRNNAANANTNRNNNNGGRCAKTSLTTILLTNEEDARRLFKNNLQRKPLSFSVYGSERQAIQGYDSRF